MKLAFIAPIEYLHLVPLNESFHLILAHLLRFPRYVEYYNKRYECGDFILLDNSAFEFKRPIEGEEILQFIERSGVKVDMLVAPDYPMQNGSKTIEGLIRFKKLLEKEGLSKSYKVMAVPQSERGCWRDWLECYREIDAIGVDFIGMSILGLPNAFCSLSHTDDIAFNRILGTQILKNEGLVSKSAKHHYLGLGQPRELIIQQQLGVAYSNDSSSAIWHGIQGTCYDSTFGGLREGKSKVPVDFELPYDPIHTTFIDFNIQLLQSWVQS